MHVSAHPRGRTMPSLELHLSRSSFATGRHLSGVVIFRLNKPTDIRSLTVAVTGCETPAGAALAPTFRRRSAFFQRETLLSGMSQPRFFSERISQYWNAFLGRDRGRILSAGEHTYPFSITLPASLPPSYRGSAGKIDYVIAARARFPLASTIQVSAEVPVVFVPRDYKGRPVALSYPTANGTVHSTDTRIHLELPQRSAELGRQIRGHFSIQNPRANETPQVKVSLEMCEWVRLGTQKEMQRNQVDSCVVRPQDSGDSIFESNFELNVPASAAPTTEGTAISVIWLLKLTVDTSPPLELKTPITICAPLTKD